MTTPKRRMKAAFLVGGMLAALLGPIAVLSSPASAAPNTCTGTEDKTWSGATDTDWATGTNWSPSGAPSSSQTVCIPGSLANSPVVTTAVTVKSIIGEDMSSLEVDAGGALTLTQASLLSSLTVNGGTVTTNGVLTVGGDASDATLDGATINGSGSLTTDATYGVKVGSNSSAANTITVNWISHDTNIYWYDGDIDNTGRTMQLNSGATLTSQLSAPHNLATNLLVGGGGASLADVSITGSVAVSDGSFSSATALSGTLTQTGGTVSASDGTTAPGTFAITGDYNHSGGELTVNTDGTGMGHFDKITVSGTYAISGTATTYLHSLNGYAGALNDAFATVAAGTRTGQYDSVDTGQSDFDPDLAAQATYSGTGVTLTLLAAPGDINGRVVFDENGNGTLDADDNQGAEGVEVYDDANNNGIKDMGEQSSTSIGGGGFVLSLVSAGVHHLRVIVPAGFKLTTTAPTDTTVTANGTATPTIGVYEYNSISGTVFNDVDGFGTKSAGDTGIAGAVVYNDANNNGTKDGGEASTTTASDGTYSLTGLMVAGNPYRPRVVAPTGQILTSGNPEDVTFAGSGTSRFDVNFGFNPNGPTQPTGPQSGGAPEAQDPSSQGTGYWMIGTNGQIYSFGTATNLGSPSTLPNLNAPIIGLTPSPQGGGYWALGADGGVFSYGTAGFYGSTGGMKLNQPVVGMASSPTGGGYWTVAKDGGVFAFGDAHFYGSTASIKLNAQIVGIAPTPSGEGYWLIAKDGGVFAYGDAKFLGGMGGQHLNSPIVGIAATASGNGYLLVAADGGVFAYGDAKYLGGMGGKPLNKPIVSIKTVADGTGYWLTASDGGVFNFGSAGFLGTPTGSTNIAQ